MTKKTEESGTTTTSVAGAGDDGIVVVDRRRKKDKPPRVLKRFRGHFTESMKQIKIVATTNSRKYKEGEVIKTFPETKKGLSQAMVFQKTISDRLGIDTDMIRDS